MVYDDQQCSKRGPGLNHTMASGEFRCVFCDAYTVPRPRDGLAPSREPAGFQMARIEWWRREAVRRGQTAFRVVPLETNYNPGLHNPVTLDQDCPRFLLFPRKHRPNVEFTECQYCRAPLWRPDV